MADPELPDDIRKLLYERVHTYEQLEVLIALRELPQCSSTAEEIAIAAHMTPESAAEALRELERSGMVSCASNASPPRYSRAVGDVDQLLGRLAVVYEHNRLEVIKLMNANAMERMRTGVLRAFSDAFVIGRKRGDR